MAVLDRNQILVHRVFRAQQRVQRTTALSFCLGWGSYALLGRIRYSCIHIARLSPTLSGSLALQHVKLGDALEIHNRIIFDFYSGLPHIRNFCKQNFTIVSTPLHSVSAGSTFIHGNSGYLFQSTGTGIYATPTMHLNFHVAPLVVSYKLSPWWNQGQLDFFSIYCNSIPQFSLQKLLVSYFRRKSCKAAIMRLI